MLRTLRGGVGFRDAAGVAADVLCLPPVASAALTVATPAFTAATPALTATTSAAAPVTASGDLKMGNCRSQPHISTYCFDKKKD